MHHENSRDDPTSWGLKCESLLNQCLLNFRIVRYDSVKRLRNSKRDMRELDLEVGGVGIWKFDVEGRGFGPRQSHCSFDFSFPPSDERLHECCEFGPIMLDRTQIRELVARFV